MQESHSRKKCSKGKMFATEVGIHTLIKENKQIKFAQKEEKVA